MKMKKGFRKLLAEAEAVVKAITPNDAVSIHGDDGMQFIDLREIQELYREGMIPRAFHAPRGMLEFWVDPDSPYHKPVFSKERNFVLYCASGWRSALATRTLIEMGLPSVMHIKGGFSAWKNAEGEVLEISSKTYSRGS